MWRTTRRTVEASVKQRGSSMVDYAQQVLPKSLPKIELPKAFAPTREGSGQAFTQDREGARRPQCKEGAAHGEARNALDSRRRGSRKREFHAGKCGNRARTPRPDAGARTPPGRPRARRRRAARRHLRSRRAAGTCRFHRGPRSRRPRRLRRRVVRRVRRRRAGERHLARADVSSVHRRRRRRRADAGNLPPPRAFRIPAARRPPAAACRARRDAVPPRPVPARPDGFARDTVARDADRDVRQPRGRRFSAAAVRGARANKRFPQARAQALPGRDESRHRRISDVRCAGLR